MSTGIERSLSTTGSSITGLPPVKFNFGGLCVAKVANRADACVDYRVHWEFIDKELRIAGREPTARTMSPRCTENSRWYLCHSNFSGLATFRTLGITRWVEW